MMNDTYLVARPSKIGSRGILNVVATDNALSNKPAWVRRATVSTPDIPGPANKSFIKK